LLAAWSAGRMPHAWLINGPRGIGKATLAYRFVRFVMAGGGKDGLFGGGADSLAVAESDPVFRRIAAGGHADLMTLEPGMVHPDTGKVSQEIVIAHVRRTIEFLLKTAAEDGWRAVIVDEAEAMNRNAANALLKVLEEPPPRCMILLISHSPGRLLPTIRSRCRSLVLRALSNPQVNTLLAKHGPELDQDERTTLVELSKGSVGRAIELADRGGVELYRELNALLDAMPALDAAAIHGLADRLARNGEDAAAGFRTVMELAADWVSRRLQAAPSSTNQWAAAWDRINRLSGATEGLNLDRKQALLVALFSIQRAAAGALATA
jgi:DNA polymerase III subunit delta'